MGNTGAKASIANLIDKTKTHLEALKYSVETVKTYDYTWRKLEKYLEFEVFDGFTVEQANRFLMDTFGFGLLNGIKKADLVKCRAIQMLLDMQNLGLINKRVLHGKADFAENFAEIFEEYMSLRREQMLSKFRIRFERNHLHQFGMYLVEKGIDDVSNIDRKIVNDFLLALAHLNTKTISDTLRTEHSFLDFAYKHSYISENLSEAVATVAHIRKNPIPSTFTEEEVYAILNAVDRGNAMGKRDYAILVLATKFGIRAGDIKALTFSNFDWDKWQISFVQQKTRKYAEFDMTEEVADAVIDYLKHGRPESNDDKIFLRHTVPYVGFSEESRLYNMFNKYTSLAGIKIPKGKRHGLHSLRHSLVSRLLEQNVAITDIAKVLVHSSIDVTKIYTAIDINALRECALEVPSATI